MKNTCLWQDLTTSHYCKKFRNPKVFIYLDILVLQVRMLNKWFTWNFSEISEKENSRKGVGTKLPSNSTCEQTRSSWPLSFYQLLKFKVTGWRDSFHKSLLLRAASCFSKEPGFDCHHPHSVSPPSISWVPINLLSSSDLHGYQSHAH